MKGRTYEYWQESYREDDKVKSRHLGKRLIGFPKPPGCPNDLDADMTHVQETYVTDAYHSLSIEGFRASPELMELVQSENLRPDLDGNDRQHRDTLAARAATADLMGNG